MSIRQSLEKFRPAVALICVLVLGATVWMINKNLKSGHRPPSEFWVYNLGTGELSTAGATQYPPLALGGGNVGYRATVFSCNGCDEPSSRQVVLLMKYSDELKAALERGLTEDDIGLATNPNSELVASIEMAQRGEWLPSRAASDRIIAEATAGCAGPGDFCAP